MLEGLSRPGFAMLSSAHIAEISGRTMDGRQVGEMDKCLDQQQRARRGSDFRSDEVVPPPSITGLLQRRAAAADDRPAYLFLAEGEVEAERLGWRELDGRARAVAAALQESCRPA